MNTENSKTNEPRNFILNLPQRLDLRSLNKHVPLQSLLFYCSWKNIKQQHKNIKLKIITSTCNDEFELPDDSYSTPDVSSFEIRLYRVHLKKNIKHYLLILLSIFTSTGLIMDKGSK